MGGSAWPGTRVGRLQRVRLARHALQRAAQVDAPAAGGFVAAQPHRQHRRRQALRQRLGQRVLVGRHGLEIGALQAFAVGEGEAGLELQFFLRRLRAGRWRRRRRLRRGQRFGHAVVARRAVLFATAADLGQQRVHQLLQQLGVAEEGVEGGVEDHLLFMPVQHHGGQRGAHVVAPVQAHGLHGSDAGEHAVGPTCRPAVRSTRAKCVMLSAISTSGCCPAARERAARPAAWPPRPLARG
jgi:hypothetical protein